MGRAINLDMYEGSSARRMTAGKYQEPVYDRRSQKSEPNRVAWKEPIVDVRAASIKTGEKGRYQERYQAAVQRQPGNIGRKSGRRKKNKMRHKILKGLCFYFFLAGIIATCWVIFSFFFGREEKVHAEGIQVQDGSVVSEGVFWDEVAEERAGGTGSRTMLKITPEIRQECQDLYTRQGFLLLLVNKEHELPSSYQPRLHSICKGRLEAADILYEDLCAMLKAGGGAGYEYWIASAYRDRAYQQGLVDEDVQKYMAKGYSYEAALQKTYEYTMPAGQSEHETGLALDILCSTNTIMDESQKSEPGNQWLVQHCHEYGFILRYPEDKEEVTGIGFEPWHFRYVGREAAAYLTEKGWTLEEFYGVIDGSI